MIDYLLKFESKEQAVEFATIKGLTTASVNDEGEEIQVPLPHGENHVYIVIGENFIPTGETESLRDETGNEWDQPVVQGDGKHWVLYRDLTGKENTADAEGYIQWSSESGDSRPEDAPTIDFF